MGLINQITGYCNKLLWYEREEMPNELRDARVLLSEEDIEMLAPLPMKGRPDQVYLLRSNLLCPLDTKRRNDMTVSLRDRLQLTIYRTMLRYTSNERLARHDVAEHGYVRFVNLRGTFYQPVRLWDDDVTFAAWAAYHRGLRNERRCMPLHTELNIEQVVNDAALFHGI